MSGGSFDYLYCKSTLLGKSEGVRGMAEMCRDWAKEDDSWTDIESEQERRELQEVAAELDRLAEWLELVERRADTKQDMLGGVLKAVEWSASGDWAASSVLEAFREVLKK